SYGGMSFGHSLVCFIFNFEYNVLNLLVAVKTGTMLTSHYINLADMVLCRSDGREILLFEFL
ncbi:hypothetical protein, partial [Sanguibacteroides sp. AM78-02pH3A]|uniref:hypothetical protein n=1 Tax=Sanguibacteroides sp. AM78-02pH3A TaxID=3002646 RepID=UPI0022E3077D